MSQIAMLVFLYAATTKVSSKASLEQVEDAASSLLI